MAAAFIGSLTPDELGALSSVPAATPPPGVVSNFVHPENRKLAFYIVTGGSFGFMIPLFQNRLYVKLFKIQKYSWDDCMSLHETLLEASSSLIATLVTVVLAVVGGRVIVMRPLAKELAVMQITIIACYIANIWGGLSDELF